MKITLENKEEDRAMHPSQSKVIPASEDILCSRKTTDTAGVNRLTTTRSSKNVLIDAISPRCIQTSKSCAMYDKKKTYSVICQL